MWWFYFGGVSVDGGIEFYGVWFFDDGCELDGVECSVVWGFVVYYGGCCDEGSVGVCNYCGGGGYSYKELGLNCKIVSKLEFWRLLCV